MSQNYAWRLETCLMKLVEEEEEEEEKEEEDKEQEEICKH